VERAGRGGAPGAGAEDPAGGLRPRPAGPGNGTGHPGSGDDPEVLNWLFLLTPREIEVLQAMADGHSTARIAVVLGISIGTVRSHVKSLLGKLGLHSRVEAVSLILRTNGRPEASLNV